jgi:hypothetical protein
MRASPSRLKPSTFLIRRALAGVVGWVGIPLHDHPRTHRAQCDTHFLKPTFETQWASHMSSIFETRSEVVSKT